MRLRGSAARGPGVTSRLPECCKLEVRPTSVWACSAAGSAPEWHSGGHRFDPGQVHHPFIFGSDFPQVAEGRCSYAGSNKAISVEREKQLLEPLALFERGLHPEVTGPRQNAFCERNCLPRRVLRAGRSDGRSERVSSPRAVSRRGGRTSRYRSSGRRGTPRPDGSACLGSPWRHRLTCRVPRAGLLFHWEWLEVRELRFECR